MIEDGVFDSGFDGIHVNRLDLPPRSDGVVNLAPAGVDTLNDDLRRQILKQLLIEFGPQATKDSRGAGKNSRSINTRYDTARNTGDRAQCS